MDTYLAIINAFCPRCMKTGKDIGMGIGYTTQKLLSIDKKTGIEESICYVCNYTNIKQPKYFI